MAKGKFTGGGSRAGSPNRMTIEFRQTVQALLDENRENVRRWLTSVAEGDGESVKPDPAKALDLLSKLAEYAAPKLSRAEVSGPDGGPLQVNIVDPTRRADSPAA